MTDPLVVWADGDRERSCVEVNLFRKKLFPKHHEAAVRRWGPWQDRFWSKVDKSGDCWLWIGRINQSGYGDITIGGKIRRAHRVSWELANGPIPDGQVICHRCDTRACVRPEHLFVGSQIDNILDCIAKGRHKDWPHGFKVKWAKELLKRIIDGGL